MGPINGIRYPNPSHLGNNQSQRQSELVRGLDMAYQCTPQELVETYRALRMIQAEMQSIEVLHLESKENREDELGLAPVHRVKESHRLPPIVRHVVRPCRQTQHRFSGQGRVRC